MNFDKSSAPIKTTLLGLPLLNYIQKDPLGAASRFQSSFGDIARLNILFRRIYYFFSPEAARQILVDHQADFTREARLLKIFESFQGKNVLTTEGADWERQRRILTPGFSPKRIAGYMGLIEEVLSRLDAERLPVATEIAVLPLSIRGYGHVRLKNAAAADKQEIVLMDRLKSIGSAFAKAAE